MLTWMGCVQGLWEALWEPQGDVVFRVNKVLVKCNQTAAPCLNGENCMAAEYFTDPSILTHFFPYIRPMPWGLFIPVLQYEQNSLPTASLRSPGSSWEIRVWAGCTPGRQTMPADSPQYLVVHCTRPKFHTHFLGVCHS